MARSTLSELSNLWEQRDVSDEEYVAALRERIEELEKLNHEVVQDEIEWRNKAAQRLERVEELEQEKITFHGASVWADQDEVLRKRAEAAEQRVRELEAKLAAWKRAESLPDCPACAALEAEGE